MMKACLALPKVNRNLSSISIALVIALFSQYTFAQYKVFHLETGDWIGICHATQAEACSAVAGQAAELNICVYTGAVTDATTSNSYGGKGFCACTNPNNTPNERALFNCNLGCPEGEQRFNGECKKSPDDKNLGDEDCSLSAGNPIHVGIGNKFQNETDFASTFAPDFSLHRTYNSLKWRQPRVFSQRWGNSWSGSFDRGVSTYDSTNVSLHRGDGREFKFTYSSTNAKWKPDGDIASTLTKLPNNEGWIFTNSDNGDIERYDNNGKLISIATRNGFLQSLTYTQANLTNALDSNGNASSDLLPAGLLLQVEDSFGHQMTFDYDVFQRVVRMTDPKGGIYLYGYDTIGNLASVKYPDNKTRTYIYNESINTSGVNLPNALTGIIDENNQRFATYKYDAQGRAISSEHAAGVEKVSIAYATDSNGDVTSSTVTDALNTARTYDLTNVLGVVKNSGASQPCSSGCGAVSTTTYDTNGNIDTKTDFNGHVTKYSYNLARNLETSRTKAFGTSKARTINTTWHSTFRLPLTITESGRKTRFTYDANGNVLSHSVVSTL